METQAIEKKAAQILLQRGVSVSLAAPLFFRILGCKKMDIEIRAVSNRKMLQIALEYLEMGITDITELRLYDAFKLYAKHHDHVCNIVALSTESRWPQWLIARQLSRQLNPTELFYLFNLILLHGGIEDFINTIRSIAKTRITKPMNLSPEEETS